MREEHEVNANQYCPHQLLLTLTSRVLTVAKKITSCKIIADDFLKWLTSSYHKILGQDVRHFVKKKTENKVGVKKLRKQTK